jgi:hypothetical protein
MFAFLFLLPVWLSIEAQSVNVLHYKYQINLNDKNDTIYGFADKKIINKNL